MPLSTPLMPTLQLLSASLYIQCGFFQLSLKLINIVRVAGGRLHGFRLGSLGISKLQNELKNGSYKPIAKDLKNAVANTSNSKKSHFWISIRRSSRRLIRTIGPFGLFTYSICINFIFLYSSSSRVYLHPLMS